jgi:hypothetical protein
MNRVRKLLLVVTVTGLAVDAYLHLRLASTYDAVRGQVSEGLLFRVEATVAVVAALLLVLRPGRVTAAVAAVVAGGGLAVLLLYRYVDVGRLGPLPGMYEPFWFADKARTAVAQGAATAAALVLVAVGWSPRPAGRGTGSAG